MGIVFKQSAWNTLTTYLGFGIGAVNTLFLYTRFLTDEYYGLVGVILSTAAILMPVMAVGVPNTLVRFYSRYQDAGKADGFLMMMTFLPLLLILPLAAFSFFANSAIGNFLARENAIVEDYVWHIFLVGIAMAYFEVYYAWVKVHLRTVSGNFLKEVFGRLGVTVLLLLVYFDILTASAFLDSLVALYLLRTLVMKLLAFRVHPPKLRFTWPSDKKEVFAYTFLIILGSSSALVLLEIDRFMINQFIPIENVAYYSVAVFIATVVAVPSRAMQQVVAPLTAGLINSGDKEGLRDLYHKSSVALFLVSGWVFLLVITNLQDIYQLVPESYRGGFIVVLLIGLVRLYDAYLGNNNAILFNSKYYKSVLLMGAGLALLTIVLNLVFIPTLGIEGAALATFLAMFLYNSLKMWYVKKKFNLSPELRNSLRLLLLLVLLGLVFTWLNFAVPMLVNIVIKTILLSGLYFLAVRRMGILDAFSELMPRRLRKK